MPLTHPARTRFVGAVLTLAACAVVGRGATAQGTAADSARTAMLARLAAADSALDFTELRLEYAALPGYDPYQTDLAPIREAVGEALAQGELERAAELARQVLAGSPLDILAHIGLSRALAGTEPARAEYHGFVARGLLEAVQASGSGRTPDSPFVVISVAEERAFLITNGLEQRLQAVTDCGGHSCDRIQANHTRTGQPLVIYFDVELVRRAFEARSRGSDGR